jgi:hypothetical protein
LLPFRLALTHAFLIARWLEENAAKKSQPLSMTPQKHSRYLMTKMT